VGISVNHATLSGLPDDGETGKVGGPNWDEPHAVNLAGVLALLDALTPAAGKLIRFTGTNAADLVDVSSYMAALLSTASGAALLTALGAAGLASPAFTGNPTAPTQLQGDNSTKLATTAYVAAAVAALVNAAPAALDTLKELADAINDDANFAATMTAALAGKVPTTRNVNTSGAITGGGALSGDLTLSLPIASQAEATAGTDNAKMMTALRVAQALAAANVTPPGGFLNKFLNGTFDVWQFGTSGTITAGSPSYTADGWYAGSTGANITWARTAGRNRLAYGLKLTGNTSVTDALVKQRIEGIYAQSLASQSVTFQAQVYNNTGGAITPTITVKRANSADNWGATTTDVNAVALQSCPNAALTQVSYTFTANAAAGNGLEITIDFGNNFSSNAKSVEIFEADLRAAGGVQTPEFRAFDHELFFASRYYFKTFGYGTAPAQNVGTLSGAIELATGAAGLVSGQVRFAARMRSTAPTVTFYNPVSSNAQARDSTNSADIAVSAGSTNDAGVSIEIAATSASRLYFHLTADARL
jgi:hypothetical protein